MYIYTDLNGEITISYIGIKIKSYSLCDTETSYLDRYYLQNGTDATLCEQTRRFELRKVI